MLLKLLRRFVPALLGSAIVLAGVVVGGVSGVSMWLVLGGTVLLFCAPVFSWKPSAARGNVDLNPPPPITETREEFKEWQQQQLESLQQQHEELDHRQRKLSQRFAGFQEFLEYPTESESFFPGESPEIAARLSEQDRTVHAILEAEAGRVYEKIRENGYSKGGNVDLETIHAEVHALVLSVAKVYSPESSNPLLETSFEQLARSASRICLHALVLLERLPIDVKRYNISELHSYLRKAVEGYGTYQQVAPWIKHISRGAYVGRFAAGTNPVTLGAWWLATEVGRRGATKLVENVVDRQAVAVLHDIVTVIGVEVANVYGPGFRQRDPAWVYGAELTELLKCFPVSRDALTEALKEITRLPLRSEYDRVYLYRCVADHRAAGFRIHDSTLLGRAEREVVAGKLEHFFTSFIHGTTVKETADWQQDVESRLDLKLSFGTNINLPATTNAHATSAITSVYSFLTTVVCTSHEQAVAAIEQTDLLTKLPLEQRVPLLESLATIEQRFEPPDLDPSDAMTEPFLQAVAETVVWQNSWEPHTEELVLECICYFRRSRDEAMSLFDAACLARVKQFCGDAPRVHALNAEQLRMTLRLLNGSAQLLAVYSGLSVEHAGKLVEQIDAVLIVIGTDVPTDLYLLPGDGSTEPTWHSAANWETQRQKGYVIDDCKVTGGAWSSKTRSVPDSIVIAGSITGRGFERTFERLLRNG